MRKAALAATAHAALPMPFAELRSDESTVTLAHHLHGGHAHFRHFASSIVADTFIAGVDAAAT